MLIDMALEPVTDRISHLPCDVIHYILGFLPLRDAVRTSMLSRDWRYKWLSVPHLVFDKPFLESLGLGYVPELVIYHMLQRHDGQTVKFLLNNYYIHNHHAMDCWLHALSNRIEYLTLEWSANMNSLYSIPHFVFDFIRLRHLRLTSVEMRLPSTFDGLGRLVRLDLINVRNALESLNTLLPKCPLLEFFSINCRLVKELMHLNISAPNLKSFHLWGVFSSVSFVNANLEDVGIGYPNPAYLKDVGRININLLKDQRRPNLIDAFRQLSSMKKFMSQMLYLQSLAMGGVPQKLPYNLNHLTVMELKDIEFGCLDVTSSILCLIRSSPNLQTFKVSCYDEGTNQENKAAVLYLKSQQSHKVPLSCSLKYVSIARFSGPEFKAEMEFVKLVLVGSPELRKLEIGVFISEVDEVGYEAGVDSDSIEVDSSGDEGEEDECNLILEILKALELEGLIRASLKAQIIIH